MSSNVKVGVIDQTALAVTVSSPNREVRVHAEPAATWEGKLLTGAFSLEDRSSYLLLRQR